MYRWAWNRFAEQHPDWSAAQLKRVVNRYTAPVHGRVPPPHSTGGAVDVMLAEENGHLRDHSAPYDPHDPACFALEAPGLSETAKRTRAILTEALRGAGLTNYPSEFWHWSYGDQGWAYRGGHPNAIYGATGPPGYTPAPEDLADRPLEWLD
jgi:D-alanyl-D-alanine dipeptidase